MFLFIVRLGIVIFSAAFLSSCGGSGQAETQQSTPEGLFIGSTAGGSATPPTTSNWVSLIKQIVSSPSSSTASTTTTSSSSTTTSTTACPSPTSTSTSASGITTTYLGTQNFLVFAVSNGVFYMFYTEPCSPTIEGAMQGTLSFGGGTMLSSNIVDVNLQHNKVFDTSAGSSPTFNGGYNTGVNFYGNWVYPMAVDNAGDFKQISLDLLYSSNYQGIQDLGTLAGTYVGTVGTSGLSESATFTFGTASVPANSGNQFGVGTINGTGKSGCAYTGTVSPLFKGNGYTTNITSGGFPCILPNTQFSGLIYLETTVAPNFLYSFAPDTARTDGLIFTGSKL